MATIEVDLVFFLSVTIIGLFGLPFIIGWTLWKGYKNPEFWLRLRKQDWVYPLIRNPLMQLKQIALPLSKIGQNGEFTLFGKRKYYWLKEDPRKEKGPGQIVFTWRHKKAAALYDWDDPYPQKWVPGNSLNSITDPANLDDIAEMKALLMMMNADSMTQLMKFALVLGIVSIIAIGGLAFTIFGMQAGLDHLTHALNNATVTPGPVH